MTDSTREHLYRVHRAGPQCPRCYFAAESQEALVIHAQAIPSCMPRSCEQPKGSSLPQEERIRRKTRRGVLPHQAWFDIFAILFPDSVPPETPCTFQSYLISGSRLICYMCRRF